MHEVERTTAQASSKMLDMRIQIWFGKPRLGLVRFWLGKWWLGEWWLGSWCTCVFVWTLARHDLCLWLFFYVVGHFQN